MYRPKNVADSANTENVQIPRRNSPLRDVKANPLPPVQGATLSLIVGEDATLNAQSLQERRGRELAR